MKVFFYHKLWVKSFIQNMFFLVLLLAILFVFTLKDQKQRQFAEIRQTAVRSAELLSQNLALSILIWDKQNIEEKINLFLSEASNIKYCIVYSKKFNESIFCGPESTDTYIHTAPVADYLKKKSFLREDYSYFIHSRQMVHIIQPVSHQTDFMLSSNLPDEMVALSPFDDGPKTEKISSMEPVSPYVGNIHLGVSFEAVDQSLKESTRFFISLSIPVIILALFFYYLQTMFLTRKLTLLTQMAEKITEGDYQSHHIEIASKDEVAILSNSFNTMVNRLIHSQKEIEEQNISLAKTNSQLDQALQQIQSFNLELERKVLDRTAELETLNITLQEKNKELKAANEAKNRFLSMMSHELRTPLNAIIGFSQVGLKRVHETATKDFFSEIKGNGEHLLALINDVLDFSKLEAGQFELFCEYFDLSPLIHEVVSATKALILGKAIELKIPDVNSVKMVFGDRMRIKQVLLNLASNASKFTQRGSIEFFAMPFIRSSPPLPIPVDERFMNRTMCVMVKDTGIGIPESKLPEIFERFKQLDASETRMQGTGLGLCISKSLVELHNTQLYIWSKQNVETTLYFFIPLTNKDMNELAL
ncbi:MAG: HAMP domain-containing protein [Candidatus Aureabacteria bacterium]|nr:HAMP domain-containing protein [Candidatus Auribacterota bacterium]